MDNLKAFIPLLARANKATVTAAVNWVSTNVALGLFHVQIGAEWQTLAATAVLAILHGVVVYFTPNKVQRPDGSYMTVDHHTIADAINASLSDPQPVSK